VFAAYYGEQIIAFHGAHFGEAHWKLYPAFFAAAAVWFLFYRLMWHYMFRVYLRREHWKLGGKKGADALLHNIVDYAESKNDATRAFVIAALGFYFTYLLYEMKVESHHEVAFPLVQTMGLFILFARHLLFLAKRNEPLFAGRRAIVSTGHSGA
jgi:hypothetical protein